MVTGCPWLRHTFICNWRHNASPTMISNESLPGFHKEVTTLYVTESRPGFRGYYKLGLWVTSQHRFPWLRQCHALVSTVTKELGFWITLQSRILFFVDCASLYNLVNKANLVHNFSLYVYIFSLHVSGDYVPIIRRNNCIYATLGTCYSVWMTVWYAGT